eukprot:scaffold4337_cov182-Ochromonas_danica.AAC.2
MDSSLPKLRRMLTNHGIDKITDFKKAQQVNGYDCGPWTVLNSDKLARKGELPKVTEADIRQQREELSNLQSKKEEVLGSAEHSSPSVTRKLRFPDSSKEQAVVVPCSNYEIEGDDSSDEEIESENYHKPLSIKHYDSLTESITFHIKNSALPGKQKRILNSIVDDISEIDGIYSSGTKISHAVKVKSNVTNILNNKKKDSQDKKTVKEAVRVAYDVSKKKDLDYLKDYATKRILESQQGSNVNTIKYDLKWSFVFQDLGIRLLTSDAVRELYFKNKKIMGTFKNLPRDEEVRDCLEKVVKKTLKKHKDNIPLILQHENYKKLLTAVLKDKREIFYLINPNSNLKDLVDNLIKTISQAAGQQSSSAVDAMFDRRLTLEIKELKAISGFVTPASAKVSVSQKVKSAVKGHFQTNSSPSLVVGALEMVYDSLKSPSLSVSDFVYNAREQLKELQKEQEEEQEEEEEFSWREGFIHHMGIEISKLQKNLVRPVLPYAINLSTRDFITNHQEYAGAKALFCFIRLIHCSAKRFIKNVKSIEDFDGAFFSRGWQFDPDKALAVVETQTLSSQLSLSSLVGYSHSSNYSELYSKLEGFKQKAAILDIDIVNSIKSLLKTGKLPEDLGIGQAFEQFLTIFTYHLFGTEVERHPAAAIHNIMALDLVKTKGFKWAFEHLPMALEEAVSVVRTIQTALHRKLNIPYHYDKALANAASPELKVVQDFIVLEHELVSAWLESKGLDVELNDDVLTEIDGLCQEFYGLSLVGESSDSETASDSDVSC